MATTSKKQPRVRPMDIKPFCDKIKNIYKPTKENPRSDGVYTRVCKVLSFLLNHTSINTTADITTSVVAEFAGTCSDLSPSTNITTVKQFRRICNLAIEWGCLKRNPFEDYQFPRESPRSCPTASRGRKLDVEQVQRILTYLQGNTDTWKGHRLFVFTAMIAYTGILTNEALELKSEDCDLDLGTLRIKRRLKFSWSMNNPTVRIRPTLGRILTAWLPYRGLTKPSRRPEVRYGTRLGDDGRSLMPDDSERNIVSDILCLRSEGLSARRIALELDSRGVPTKRGGAKWSAASVKAILKREQGISGTDISSTDDRDKKGARSDPDWIFPNTYGNGHWARSGSPGHPPHDQIRDVGKTLGIEGLTFESLRRFYLEHTHPTLDLEWDEVSARPNPPSSSPIKLISGPQGSPPNKDLSTDPAATLSLAIVIKAKPPVPVLWRGTWAELQQEIDAIESHATRDVVRKLIELMPNRPTEKTLEIESKHGDAVNLLRKLADTGCRLGQALGFPGKGKPGYWIVIEINQARST